MKNQLKTALLLAVAINSASAEEKCFPNPSLVEVLKCFQGEIGELVAENNKQQGQISKLIAKTEKQQTTINTQQQQLAALKKENKSLKSPQLQFFDCGGTYTCTPRMCLDKCISLGLRMATYDEVHAWASAGKDYCGHIWKLDSQHPDRVSFSFPMYSNLPKLGGCGRSNTGNIPRLEGEKLYDWDSTKKANCACAKVN